MCCGPNCRCNSERIVLYSTSLRAVVARCNCVLSVWEVSGWWCAVVGHAVLFLTYLVNVAFTFTRADLRSIICLGGNSVVHNRVVGVISNRSMGVRATSNDIFIRSLISIRDFIGRRSGNAAIFGGGSP